MSNEMYHHYKDDQIFKLTEYKAAKLLGHVTDRIQRIANQIPLENYKYIKDDLTDDSGYLAPKGMAFRVTGFFEQSFQTGGDEINLAPTFPSFQLWVDNLHNNPEEVDYLNYFNQLIKQGISQSEAYALVYTEMQDDKYYLPNKLSKHFDGKILVLPKLNFDSGDNIAEQSQVFIKQPKLTTYEKECLGVIDIPFDGETKSVFYNYDQANIINWYEPIAIINLFHPHTSYKISLIKSNKFENQNIVVPTPANTKITKPYPNNP